MTDPRRSARSTKGVNSRLSDLNVVEHPSPAPKRRKSTPKNATSPPPRDDNETDEEEDKSDDIIRCVCGATEEDEDDERMMIQCEGCEAWQHTQCMGIPKKKIPKQYFCEQCQPDQHKFLLEQMAKGEKPWEKKGGRKKKSQPKSKEDTPPKEAKQATPTPADKKSKTPAKETPDVAEKATPAPRGRKRRHTPVVPDATSNEEAVKVEENAPPEAEKGQGNDNIVSTSAPTETAPPPPSSPPPEARQPSPSPTKAENVPKASPAPAIETVPTETKMDIDVDNSNLQPAVTKPDVQDSDRKDSVATVSAEETAIAPSTASVLTPPTGDAKAKSLPPINTEAGATKPKARRESMDKPVTPSAATPKSAKRKNHDSDGEYKADDSKEQHAEKKQRKASITPATTPKVVKQDRRKSTAKPTPAKKAKEDTTPQTELVASVSELRNSNRQSVANYLIICLTEHAKRLVSEKKITLRPEDTVETLCENRALQIEHHIYMNHFAGGQIVPEYQKRSRSIGYNLKSNSSLSDEILGGRLSCERLSHMTTEEMASKELKELTQQVRLESEKHNTLINDSGPRIRRTHKGEELVTEDGSGQSQDTLLGSGTVIRRPVEVVMDDAPISSSAQPDSPTQPADSSMSPTTTVAGASEPPRSPSQPMPTETAAPVTDKAKSFNIENVWSHVESPDTERRPSRAAPPVRALPTPTRLEDSKLDKDIDMLLKDDDQDAGTPPYSPPSYDDHYSPKPNEEDEPVWRGRIDMTNIASLNATATVLGGPESIGDKRWLELLDPILNIDGRIKHERATEYLCGQKFSKSSSMVLASIKPEHSTNQTQFNQLFDYFKKKDRYAVVGKHGQPCIKDLYIVPIEPDDTLPDWFNVVDPPSKVPERNRSSRMLVLIFVVIRSLVSGYVENSNGTMARRPSVQQEFGTPQQPQASPYTSAHPQLPQHQYQASPLAPQPNSHQQQHSYTQAPAVSQPAAQQMHFAGQPSPLPYGYPQPQYSPSPQQQPHSLPAIQPGLISPSSQPLPSLSPQNHSAQPQSVPVHQQPKQPVPAQQAQPSTYKPKHPMTQELLGVIPNLSESQTIRIDRLLQEHPDLATRPEDLAKEVEKVLSM